MEVQNKLPPVFNVKTLHQLNFNSEIEETGSTLEENAKIKAETIYNKFKSPCFADDTGLEVEALNGAPGVFSARFAGPNATYKDNCNLLLTELKSNSNRKAAFRTVFCFINQDGNRSYFEGKIGGTIALNCIGSNGFGYDSVFIPDGYSITFAQMELSEKNEISHRSAALAKLVSFLSRVNH